MRFYRLGTTILSVSLAMGVSSGFALAQNDSGAKQSMRDAGHETKDAAKDTGHGIKQGTKKAYHKTKHGVKKVHRKMDPDTPRETRTDRDRTTPQQ